jgi:hypothetical protein
MQEIGLQALNNPNLLTFPGFNLEVEINNIKSRAGVYIKNDISYRRRTELEGQNSHLVVINIFRTTTARIIYINRTFKPQVKGTGLPEKISFTN